jgi:hypothetical protein
VRHYGTLLAGLRSAPPPCHLLRCQQTCVLLRRQLLELLQRERPTEQESLIGMAIQFCQKVTLRFGFDPFRDHRQAAVVTEREDGAYDDGVIRIGQYVACERPVDLQLVER